jgi:hypothetical protein
LTMQSTRDEKVIKFRARTRAPVAEGQIRSRSDEPLRELPRRLSRDGWWLQIEPDICPRLTLVYGFGAKKK